MRGIPQGHDNQRLILCHDCSRHNLQDNCEQRDLQGVIVGREAFQTSYNGRLYFVPDEIDTVTMWRCAYCSSWMRDPGDDDPRTPHMWDVVPWKCGECGDLFPDKHEADQCCS